MCRTWSTRTAPLPPPIHARSPTPCGVGITFALAEGREQMDKKRLKYHGGILPRGQPHGRLMELLCSVYACASRLPGLVWLARTAPPEEWRGWRVAAPPPASTSLTKT